MRRNEVVAPTLKIKSQKTGKLKGQRATEKKIIAGCLKSYVGQITRKHRLKKRSLTNLTPEESLFNLTEHFYRAASQPKVGIALYMCADQHLHRT